MHRFTLAALLLAVSVSEASSTAETADRIVVNKAMRELLLFRKGRVLRSYKVALGRNPVGAKQQEGDGKTPEGEYAISGRNAASKFHKALRISYPNESDRARAQRVGVSPGGDIMIHGLPNGFGYMGTAHRLRDWTEGCIAVTNAEIEEIWRLVPDGTTVQIHP